MTKSDVGLRGVTTEEQWKEMEGSFLNGETFKSIALRTGFKVHTLQYQATRRKWRERLQAAKLGKVYEEVIPDASRNPMEVEIEEAKGLKGKHGRKYYKDLDVIAQQIDHLDKLVLGCSDSMQIDQLTKSLDRLRERYRIIQGISGPVVLKGEKERKIKSAPILPLDG